MMFPTVLESIEKNTFDTLYFWIWMRREISKNFEMPVLMICLELCYDRNGSFSRFNLAIISFVVRQNRSSRFQNQFRHFG